MEIVTFDLPLLLGGVALLVWMRFFQPAYVFHVGCQVVGSFWAQYSFVVSWSLAKLVPILAATSPGGARITGTAAFLPFAVYVLFVSLIGAVSWDIPSNVSAAYGEYRVWIQLFNFLVLAFAARGLAAALLHPRAPFVLWQALTLAVVLHGLFSLYQFTAWHNDWTLVGISRAHGETLREDVADIGAFDTELGTTIIRPGGLAGEPKTVAVLYAIYILTYIFVGPPPRRSRHERVIGAVTVAIATVGYILAFSTSVFIGSLLAVMVLIARLGIREPRAMVTYAIMGGVVCFLLWQFFKSVELGNLADLLELRSLARLKDGVDPPVEASLQALWHNSVILLFGTGLGGSSFVIMKYLGVVYDYAVAPNVGLVGLVVESGIVGTLLFLFPFILLAVKPLPKGVTRETIWNSRYLLGLGLATMCLILVGSGIAMAPVLAIGAICGYSQTVSVRPGKTNEAFI